MSWKVKGKFVWRILKRDFKRFSHSKNSDLNLLGNGLLEELDKVFVLNNNYKDKKINNVYFLTKIEQIKSKMLFWLRKIRLLPNADQARRVAENI
jgi:transposase